MLIVTMLLMFIATLALNILLCFMKKDGWVYLAFKTFSLIALIFFGVSCAAYRANFSGFAMLAILNIVPLFLTTLDYKQKPLEVKEEAVKNRDFSKQFGQKPANFTPNGDFLTKITPVLAKLGYPLSGICLSICALYLGKETPFGILAGILLGSALTFLTFILKKEKFASKTDCAVSFLEKFCIFLTAGLAICQIITVLLYAFSISNILFCISLLVYVAHLMMLVYFDHRFNFAIYNISAILLFLAILF